LFHLSTTAMFAGIKLKGSEGDKKKKKKEKKEKKKKEKKKQKRARADSSSDSGSSSDEDDRPAASQSAAEPASKAAPQSRPGTQSAVANERPVANDFSGTSARSGAVLAGIFGGGPASGGGSAVVHGGLESRMDRKRREMAESKRARGGNDSTRSKYDTGARNIDDNVVPANELNPIAYQENVQELLETMEKPASAIPAHLMCDGGDGGEQWRRRAERRRREAERDPALAKQALEPKRYGDKDGGGGKNGKGSAGGKNSKDGGKSDGGPARSYGGKGFGDRNFGEKDGGKARGKSEGAGKNPGFDRGARREQGLDRRGDSRSRTRREDRFGDRRDDPRDTRSYGDRARGPATREGPRRERPDDDDAFGALRAKYRRVEEAPAGTGGKGGACSSGAQAAANGSARKAAAEQAAERSPAEAPPAPQELPQQPKIAGVPEATEALDANEMQARAMEAMLSGDMATYEKINEMLKDPDRFQVRQAEVQRGAGPGVAVMSEVDAKGRSVRLMKTLAESGPSVKLTGKLRGKVDAGRAGQVLGEEEGRDGSGDEGGEKKVKLAGYYEDDDVSLEELVRREKIAGQQEYEANFASHVMKQGKRFRQRHDDDDEALDLGAWEERGKKMDAKKRRDLVEKGRKGEALGTAIGNAKGSKDRNLERCHFCAESKVYSYKHRVIAQTERVVLALQAPHLAFVDGELVLFPKDHGQSSVNDMDEDTYEELRQLQVALVAYFREEAASDDKRGPVDPLIGAPAARAPVFVEVHKERISPDKKMLGAFPHCCVHVYPVDLHLLNDCAMFFEQALREAEDDFERTHKAVIKCGGGQGGSSSGPSGGADRNRISSSVRGNMAASFPYFHVDFALQHGMAHVVDEKENFPHDFATNVISGVLELDVLQQKDIYRTGVVGSRGGAKGGSKGKGAARPDLTYYNAVLKGLQDGFRPFAPALG